MTSKTHLPVWGILLLCEQDVRNICSQDEIPKLIMYFYILKQNVLNLSPDTETFLILND